MLTSRLSSALITCCLSVFFMTAAFAAKPGDWPQWRGPQRDGLSTSTGLLKEWPEDGPEIAWQVDGAGVGYASLAVADGRVFTQGDLDGIEHVICFSEENGSILWSIQPEPAASLLAETVNSQFERFDANKDGVLDEVEALNGLGWNFNNADSETDEDKDKLAAARAAAMFKEFDKDGNGQLTFDESPNAMKRELPRIDAEDTKTDAKELAAKRSDALLAEADKDDDGKISREEAGRGFLGQMFRNIDQRDPVTRKGDDQLTDEEISKYFLQRERGRDGLVTVDELQSYYASRFPGRDGKLTKENLRSYYGGYRNGMGDGPRGTPTVDGYRVYALGGNGDFTCLDAASGKTIWHVHLQKELNGGRPGWGYSESPLVDGEMVIVTPGGRDGSVAAFNKMTGELIWRSTDVTDAAHYASAITANIHDVHQIVQFTRSRVVGLDAKDGSLLWEYAKAANGTANCATPIYQDGYVFSSSGYGTGGGLCKVTKEGDSFSSEEVYFEKSMANHHGGIVMFDGYMYGFGNGGLLCMNFKTGEIAWRARSVNKGSLCYADGHLYLLGERNALALAEANSGEYVEKGRIDLPRSDRPSWAHPVVANGRLYVRDQGLVTSYDIRPGK